MDKLKLRKLYKKHLIESVGKKQSSIELKRIDIIMNKSHQNLNNKSNIKRLYNEKLFKIWPRIVANENSPDELLLLNDFVQVENKFSITSIASGICVFEMFLARYFCPNGKISCIDFSKQMNKKGLNISRKIKLKNIHFFTAPATKLPIKDNSQNVVLARRTGLSMKRIWGNVLKEVNRILIKNEKSRFVYTVQANLSPPIIETRDLLKKKKMTFISKKYFKESDGTKIVMVIAKPLIKKHALPSTALKNRRFKFL